VKATPETTNPQSPFSLGLMDRCITDSMVWLERAVHYARRLGLHKNMVTALSELSLLAYIAGDHDRAVQLLEERLSVTVAHGRSMCACYSCGQEDSRKSEAQYMYLL